MKHVSFWLVFREMGNLLIIHKDIKRKIVKEYLDSHDVVLLAYSVGIKLRIPESRIETAAYNGQLNIVKWALDQKCDNTEFTCAMAAAGGQLETLKYLRERGSPWDNFTTHFASEELNFDILKWAIDNGCDQCSDMCFSCDDKVSCCCHYDGDTTHCGRRVHNIVEQCICGYPICSFCVSNINTNSVILCHKCNFILSKNN